MGMRILRDAPRFNWPGWARNRTSGGINQQYHAQSEPTESRTVYQKKTSHTDTQRNHETEACQETLTHWCWEGPVGGCYSAGRLK
jgi:hypothetical protein